MDSQIDRRDALDRAIARTVQQWEQIVLGRFEDVPDSNEHPPRVPCAWDINYAIAVLDALGLSWSRQYDAGWCVAVGPSSVVPTAWRVKIPAPGHSAMDTATAIVQAALTVLSLEVRDVP